MSVYHYTGSAANNITWGSTDNWANEVSGLSNICTSGSANAWADDMYDLPTAPVCVGSYLRNQSIFYGTVSATANGSVRVAYPYTTSYTTGAITIKNVNLTTYSYVRLQASPTYPYVFQKWTIDSGGGVTVGTSSTLDLTVSALTAYGNFYAWFTGTSVNSTTLNYNTSAAQGGTAVCTGGTGTTSGTYYWAAADGADWKAAYALYTNSTLTTVAPVGFVSDGSYWSGITANGVLSGPTPCGI